MALCAGTLANGRFSLALFLLSTLCLRLSSPDYGEQDEPRPVYNAISQAGYNVNAGKYLLLYSTYVNMCGYVGILNCVY